MTAPYSETLIEQLNAGNVKNFDPIQFEFIKSLSTRLNRCVHGEMAELTEKLQLVVEQYLDEFDSASGRAKLTLDNIRANFPQHVNTAQDLFELCQFKQLERFGRGISRQISRDHNLSELRNLIADINQTPNVIELKRERASVDDLLHKQSQVARLQPGEELTVEPQDRGEQLELKSMKHHRQSLKHFNVDKIIARAINEGPENPGPLNPQMLAIKSLAQMSNLSPQYLRRFAGYIETLLWLEKSSAKLSNSKKRS